jgi:hypothetical protein
MALENPVCSHRFNAADADIEFPDCAMILIKVSWIIRPK